MGGAVLEPRRQEQDQAAVRSSEQFPLELQLVLAPAVARLWAHSTCVAPRLPRSGTALVRRRGQGARGQVLALLQQQELYQLGGAQQVLSGYFQHSEACPGLPLPSAQPREERWG